MTISLTTGLNPRSTRRTAGLIRYYIPVCRQMGKYKMRYAIFGDIHGNLEALEAVLEKLEQEKPDRYICGATPILMRMVN